jgi:uncharacterized protein YndB with AHSA1/START domain
MTAFRTSRLFPARPDAVFAALADPSRLAKWWGPSGFSNMIHEFDFRPGGRWTFSMHGPDGQTFPNECLFSTIIDNAKVVIRHQSQPRFDLTITLHEEEGGTLVTWEQEFDDASIAIALRPIVEPANEQNLDRWAGALRTSPPSPA